MSNNHHPTFANGKICYLEIPAKDVDVSSKFYREVFEWRIREHEDGSIAFDDAAGEVSGTWVINRPSVTGESLMLHIMVFNIEDTIKLILKYGGEMKEYPDKADHELVAKFSDPAGNVFGLYQQPA
ncbi:MAG: VOC family protein [Ginsengibacter sp.]